VALLGEGYATITVLTGVGSRVGEDGIVDAASIRRLAETLEPARPDLRPVRPSAQP
jgi:hypothetical protein